MAKKDKQEPKVSKSEFPVSEALKETVKANPSIKEVYFRKDGKHYFNAYEHGENMYGQIHIDKVLDRKRNVVDEVKSPVRNSQIVGVATREEILGSADL